MVKSRHEFPFFGSLVGYLVILTALMMTGGCSSEPAQFDKNIKGPQLIVQPESVSLGVAKLLGAKIIFKGIGFRPGEKFMIVLSGGEKTTSQVAVPLSFGQVEKDSTFETEVEKKTKIFNLLRGDVHFGEKGAIVLITDSPIPTGRYIAKATGYESDKTAQCEMTLKPPSLIDKIKDWLGGLLGNIEKE
ncbi:MAG: hypothetical protein HQ589_05365 [Syntrophaceae bacterium]|nr:hypothetical protein [Syntrophaceae bacterium]